MWQTEERFVEDWVDLLPTVAGSTAGVPIVWTEQRTGFGRPDILLMNTRSAVLEERSSRYRDNRPLTRLGAFAMSLLIHRRWISFDSVALHLKITRAKALAVGDELESRGLVYRRLGSLRARPLKECMAIQSVVTFEAKLREWRRAILQAQRHLWFAQASYVLLAHAGAAVIPQVAAACRASQVGLIVPGADSRPRVAVPSSRGRPKCTYLLWLLNERLIDAAQETVTE